MIRNDVICEDVSSIGLVDLVDLQGMQVADGSPTQNANSELVGRQHLCIYILHHIASFKILRMLRVNFAVFGCPLCFYWTCKHRSHVSCFSWQHAAWAWLYPDQWCSIQKTSSWWRNNYLIHQYSPYPCKLQTICDIGLQHVAALVSPQAITCYHIVGQFAPSILILTRSQGKRPMCNLAGGEHCLISIHKTS